MKVSELGTDCWKVAFGVGLCSLRCVRTHSSTDVEIQTSRYVQVKEGTENRGAIESVVRIVRKSVRLSQLSLSSRPVSQRFPGLV